MSLGLRACSTAGDNPYLVPNADIESATSSKVAGLRKRFAKGEGQTTGNFYSNLTVRAFHSPISIKSKTKADPAAYGIKY